MLLDENIKRIIKSDLMLTVIAFQSVQKAIKVKAY